MLVHGLFGSANKWNDFVSQLSGANINVDTFRADYASLNTAGFDVIYSAVPRAIQQAIATSRGRRVAATRVDVVAHSMGTDATRWYMTPSSQLPQGVDRGSNPVVRLEFKSMPIYSRPRPPENEFLRADNFGIGDVRRLITFGGVHTGTDLVLTLIKVVNAGIRFEYESHKERLKVVGIVGRKFKFEPIALSEPGVPGPEGMALVDLCAFGPHPITDSAIGVDGLPPRSVALNALLTPIPVKYAAVEGTWDLSFLDAPWLSLRQDVGNVLLGLPSDIQPDVSDGAVPAASARNLGARVTRLYLPNTSHTELITTSSIAPIMEQLLGTDESLFK